MGFKERISFTALKKAAITGVEFACKHSPAILMIGAGVLGAAAIVVGIKDSHKNDEELTQIEKRKEIWDEYEAFVKEQTDIYERESLYMERNREELMVLLDSRRPDEELYPKVTFKEMVVFACRTYGKSALLFLGAGVCAVSAFMILNNRIAALSSALGTAVAQYETLHRNIEEEYGKEVADRMASPYKTTQKAHGRRSEVIEADDNPDSNYNGIWFHESEDFVKDDYEYNIQLLREINNEISNYYRTHNFLSKRRLLDKFFHVKDVEKIKSTPSDMGWRYEDWSGLSFETASDISTTFPDPEGGRFRSIFVSFPLRWSFKYEPKRLGRVV